MLTFSTCFEGKKERDIKERFGLKTELNQRSAVPDNLPSRARVYYPKLKSSHLHLTYTMSAPTMSVSFLGTSSGGGPSESRNCSSLVCDMLADKSLWSAESLSLQLLRALTFLPVVDCAEGTTRQFALQPHYTKPHVSIQKVSKIFITHMHGRRPNEYRECYF